MRNKVNIQNILSSNYSKISKIASNLSDKLSKISGLDNPHLCSSDSASFMNVKSDFTKSIRGASNLSQYLSYRYYDPENNLFFDDEGTIGFIMELSPIVGTDISVIKNLNHFFNNEMPDNSFMQFLLIASNDISPILNRWQFSRISSNPALAKLAQKREDLLKNLASNFKEAEGRFVRDYKLYAVYTEKTSKGLSSLSSSQPNIDLTKASSLAKLIVQKFDSINLSPRLLEASDLIKLVREVLELNLSINSEAGSNKDSNHKYDTKRLLADQILSPLTLHEVIEDRVIHHNNDLATKSYLVSELPEEFSLNMMINLLGDSLRDNLSIPARFIVSYIVANNINPGRQMGIVQKGEKIIENSEQWYCRNNRDIKREAFEWRDINDRSKQGERLLSEYFTVSITAPKDYIDIAEVSLISLYNIHNWRLELNRYFQLPALLSILPFQVQGSYGLLSEFKLTKLALSSEIAAKLPIHAEWKGVPMAGMLLVGRRGQLFNFNPFYRISSGNYNICVFGPSGSGKSVFLQDLATNMAAQNAKIFILDIGQSFKNILLDGEMIQFGAKSNIVLNPFVGFKDEMDSEDKNIAIIYAKAIIASMTKALGDPLKESIIERAISKGLELHGNQLDITKLAEVILEGNEQTEIAKYLSMSLYSYTKDGIYGKFFDSKNSIDSKSTREAKFDKQITIFEFEEIKNNPLLLSVILQIIGMQIFMQFLTGDRSKRFLLIVDEAWMILDFAAKFLADFARTIRKYGGSLVTCVQNFTDLDVTDDHRAILQNSTWTVLLKQDEKGINSFKSSEAFKDKIDLIKSISINPNKYSECLICATGISVVGRLVLDNYSKILYSTDSEVFRALNELKEQGHTIESAAEILEERKYGK